MPLSKRRRSKSQPEQLQEDDHAMQMLKLPSPFEFEDDWWSSPATATEHKTTDEGVVDPLLHFPSERTLESESTLKGISLTPPALPVAQLPAAQGAPGKRRAVKKVPVQPGSLGVDPKGKAISPRESHILSERQRRKGMNHLFTTLASLLPDNFSKSDKSTIVSEIILYIHSLRKDLDELDKKRSEALRSSSVKKTESGNSQHSACTVQHVPDVKMMKVNDVVVKSGQVEEMRSTRAPNVVLSVCGNDVFITISSSTEVKNLFSKALMIIQQHNLTFVDANISNSSSKSFHYFHVKALQAQHLPKDDTLQQQLQSLTTADPSSLSMTVL